MRIQLPKTLVARTTLAIVVLSIAMGLVLAATISILVQRHELTRLRGQLEDLVSAVDSTVRIACYVNDASLAGEIGDGLLQTHAVAGYRILSGGTTLSEGWRDSARGATGPAIDVISHEIHSPFNPAENIGLVTLYVANSELALQAWSYTRFTLLMLSALATMLAIGVACVVYLLITRPIKSVSDDLHSRDVASDARLHLPWGNESNEIGRLVGDVNHLIGNLSSLLGAERELRVEHEVNARQMRLVFERAGAGIFVMQADGTIQSCNPAFVRILGLGGDAPATGRRLQEVLPLHAASIADLTSNCLATGESCEVDLEMGDLSTNWVELSLNPIGNGLLQGIANDVSERKRTEMSAVQAASHDLLTGLLNRRGLDIALTALFDHSGGGRVPASALMQLDLDFFKPVNDTYGHDAGDAVLRHVARTLERTVRKIDLLGRYGGDEFRVVLLGLDVPAKAEEIAANIIAAISEPIDLDECTQVRISASIGIAFPSGPHENADSIWHRADEALYAAKEAGRGRACVARPPESPDPRSNSIAA